MSSAESALQQAVYDALIGDLELTAIIGDNAVHDRQLPKTDMPYVLIGDLQATDYGSGGESAQEIILTLEAWSASQGKMQAQQMAGLIRARLDDAALALGDGFSLVSLFHRRSRIRRQSRTQAHVAELTFRAVVE